MSVNNLVGVGLGESGTLHYFGPMPWEFCLGVALFAMEPLLEEQGKNFIHKQELAS